MRFKTKYSKYSFIHRQKQLSIKAWCKCATSKIYHFSYRSSHTLAGIPPSVLSILPSSHSFPTGQQVYHVTRNLSNNNHIHFSLQQFQLCQMVRPNLIPREVPVPQKHRQKAWDWPCPAVLGHLPGADPMTAPSAHPKEVSSDSSKHFYRPGRIKCFLITLMHQTSNSLSSPEQEAPAPQFSTDPSVQLIPLPGLSKLSSM